MKLTGDSLGPPD